MKEKDDPIVILLTVIGGLLILAAIFVISYLLSSGNQLFAILGLTIVYKDIFFMIMGGLILLALARMLEIMNKNKE